MEMLEYENRIVAFIDILGFKRMVADSKRNQDMFNTIIEVLNTMKAISNNLNDDYYISTSCETAIFSDNIVISYPTKLPNAFYYLALNSMHLQLALLQKEVLVRGGISSGKLYHKSNLVFGPALVNAYQIETEYAIYPRIVVDKNIEVDETICSIDFDGAIYIDPFNLSKNKMGFANYSYILKKALTFIKRQIKNNKSMGVIAKYKWLENHIYNTFEIKDRNVFLDKAL